ncbi:hypothetical protein CLNEO_23570 [Anaerotignum neopropionicum]|uniref:Uncharacterized protein n=1 Tax=Anaerotignum neopropionicum TaxID=36847 RepID=A0A136WCF5_9FIRM|nr:hypothetical protein [Anaerotignum neopropionicum]KXL52192.1 hypothetical protein CLNEO_23570 [Anaerotignum neopropionicum]
MAIAVTVTTNETLSEVQDNAVLDITFTNLEAFTYAAESTVYYLALLTDSTPVTPLTREVTFSVYHETGGTVDADETQSFTFENTTNLIPEITGSDGRICYMA